MFEAGILGSESPPIMLTPPGEFNIRGRGLLGTAGLLAALHSTEFPVPKCRIVIGTFLGGHIP